MMHEPRPWGRYEILYADEDTWLKKLIIAPGQSLSLQVHQNRNEYWYTTDEGVRAIMGGQDTDHDIAIQPGHVYPVLAGDRHRLMNTSDKEVVVIEWAVGRPTESDIIRIEDNYGRA
jgi:mannose-1-phosphate guanylyltransferase